MTVTIRAICDGCGKRRSLCVPNALGFLLCPDCALADAADERDPFDGFSDADVQDYVDDQELHIARDEGKI